MPRGAPAFQTTSGPSAGAGSCHVHPTRLLEVVRRKKRCRRRSRRAVGVRKCHLGDGLLGPRERGRLREKGGVSIICGCTYLTGFRVPGLGIRLHGRRVLPAMESCNPPKGGECVPVNRLVSRAHECVHRGPWFEPHVSSMFYCTRCSITLISRLIIWKFGMVTLKPIRGVYKVDHIYTL